MLRPSDLSGFDLPKLAADLEASALRQDRCRRLAATIGIPDECRETTAAAAKIDADAAATAEAARLVSLVRRFMADEASGRPSAAVVPLRVVPRAAPRPGIFARTMTALGRPAPDPAATDSLPASGKARA